MSRADAGPNAGARKSWRIVKSGMHTSGSSSGSFASRERFAHEVGQHLGAERGDLVAQFAGRACREPQLQVAHAHRAQLVERLDDGAGVAGERALRCLPRGRAEVDVLGDVAELDGIAGTGAVAVLEDVGDVVGEARAGRALRDPAVTA